MSGKHSYGGLITIVLTIFEKIEHTLIKNLNPISLNNKYSTIELTGNV